ncbi:MAG: gamma-glutamyl-gamma-aminobutyrate hydrolase family protein [Clostridia bacterium]|nr:gamma-glutamyl-gamma-aminobutyrate hydrolase family protein [Clostridia bacterium]
MRTVGVMPLYNDKKGYQYMLPEYMESLISAGLAPLEFPLTDNDEVIDALLLKCDGLLFTGGHDVGTCIYNEEVLNDTVVMCPMLDRLEEKVLSKAMEKEIPVFGICRGMQFINAALGGTLYQDIPSQYETDIKHNQDTPNTEKWHKVTVVKGTMLYDCIGEDVIEVNSTHHQAVKDVAPGFTVTAVSEDGITEGIAMNDKPVFGVQWHPEALAENDEASRRIFKCFRELIEKAR